MRRVEDTHWWYRALHRLIRASLDEYQPDWRRESVLDAGCGTGGLLAQLNALNAVGVDWSPEAVRLATARGLTNVHEADINALPFPDQRFDAAISANVLYHAWVADVAAATREMRRVLKPNGILLLNLPAFDFLTSAHDRAVMTARRFRRAEVRALLIDSGFAIEQLTYWTTLLFPAAVAARTFRLADTGRDFDRAAAGNRVLDALMSFELSILRRVRRFPFGVALFAVARKRS